MKQIRALFSLVIFGVLAVQAQPGGLAGPSAPQNTGTWRTYAGEHFSFEYPSFLQCCKLDNSRGYIGAYASGPQGVVPMLGVSFKAGFKNKPNLAVQCASLDDLLREEFAEIRKKADHYNQTEARDGFSRHSVTYEGPHPGLLGGRSISVSYVMGNGGFKEVTAIDIWSNALIRKNGAFLVEAAFLRAESQFWEPIRQRFAKSVRVGGERLDKSEMCSGW